MFAGTESARMEVFMKIAVGMKQATQIYDKDYLQFLHQIGVTHVLGFTPDTDIIPSAKDGYWGADDLIAMVRHFNENGLEYEAIENFLPRHWYKILMDLPGKEEQLDNIKRTITNMGKAKIPIMGYHFSAGGVIGRYQRPLGRGNAISVTYDPEGHPFDNSPIPKSMAWGRVVDPEAQGVYDRMPRDEMRDRLYWFLEQILPVCADANVCLAAHPEDPPVPELRSAGRVLISPEEYDEMFKRFPTPYCTVEFCQGTFTEMGVNIYETIEHFASQNRIAYVHLRNVRGVVPCYDETLIDDGDVDMAEALMAYHRGGYDGTFIPDHYPILSSAVGDHATVAYSIGHIRGLMKALKLPIWGE